MTDRQALIARLEAASEGSRELDAEIYVCAHPVPASDAAEAQEDGSVRIYHEMRLVHRFAAPHYTTSLDSALSLVPEGAEWAISPLYGVPRAEVGLNFEHGPSAGYARDGVTPALALCIAALKAQESG